MAGMPSKRVNVIGVRAASSVTRRPAAIASAVARWRPAALEPGEARAGQDRQRQQPQPAEADDGANALQQRHVIEEPVIAGHRRAERQHDADDGERHHGARAMRPPGRGVGQGDARQRQRPSSRERADVEPSKNRWLHAA